MYDELIMRLRASCEGCKLWDGYRCCLKGDCTVQTRLQAANAIEELTAAVDGYESSTNMALVEKDGKTVVEFQPKWIPVTERLPGNEVPVLVVRRFLGVKDCPPKTYVEMAEFCYGDWIADSDEYKIARHRHTDPLYWMPLPEPPKEEL